MSYRPEPAFRHDRVPRIGVLLVNLGTPDAPTPAAVRRYLAEFLTDPRVVEIPRAVWRPLLHGVVLRTRPAKSALYGLRARRAPLRASRSVTTYLAVPRSTPRTHSA